MGDEDSLPCPQKHAIGLYPEPDESTPQPHTPFLLRSNLHFRSIVLRVCVHSQRGNAYMPCSYHHPWFADRTNSIWWISAYTLRSSLLFIIQISSTYYFFFSLLFPYLVRGATVLVALWPPHIFYVRFRDSKFLQGEVVSPTSNPQPGGPGYFS
jgi:hypothetical protein